MREVLFRCSSVGKLMTEPKTKTEGLLSKGAKTYIRELVAQEVFGIDFEVSSKAIEKGLLVEGEAIAMLNRVRGLSLAKNTERRDDGFITGECDLFDAARRRGHDLKCSWSAATFPITVEDCKDSLYEWQMRSYMRLWDGDEWEVNYALVNTPEALIGYEPLPMHVFDHIPEHHRITTWTIKRDAALEAAITEKIKAAREYYREVVAEFERTHPSCAQAVAEAVYQESPPPWEPTEPKPAGKPVVANPFA